MAKKPQNLVTKLTRIMRTVGQIEKRGYNEVDEYSYATEGDVKDAFRPLLARANVLTTPRVLEIKSRAVTLPLRSGPQDTWVSDLIVEWAFRDGDSSEVFITQSAGSGEDKADKGVAKAITGSLKSLFLSMFLIRSGDDPDATSKTVTKEVREKKIEAAQEVGRAKLEGRAPAQEIVSLWYTFPPEAKGLHVAVYGSDAAFKKFSEELRYHGKYVPSAKCYDVPAAKLDDLKFVLAQFHVNLKEASPNGDNSGRVEAPAKAGE
jgi:ERF superfamily